MARRDTTTRTRTSRVIAGLTALCALTLATAALEAPAGAAKPVKSRTTTTSTSTTSSTTTTAAPTTAAFSDGFDNLPVGLGWADGSVHGAWKSVYNGYGSVGIENVDGTNVLSERPQASTTSGETHASLVVTNEHFGDSDISLRMQTVKQLRTPTPNPWETNWLVWNYTHDQSFYYLALKTNGWELGKVDATKIDPNGPACFWPSYENCKYDGAQRYLATGTNMKFPAGTWNDARVKQVGGKIEVWANGTLLTTFTDTENVYRSGAVGLYNEDAYVRFDDVRITPAI